MPKGSTYGKVARLCQMYLDQHRVYVAMQQPPKMAVAARRAEGSLLELMEMLEAVISPITFKQKLERNDK